MDFNELIGLAKTMELTDDAKAALADAPPVAKYNQPLPRHHRDLVLLGEDQRLADAVSALCGNVIGRILSEESVEELAKIVDRSDRKATTEQEFLTCMQELDELERPYDE
jgi:hypothetical protein